MHSHSVNSVREQNHWLLTYRSIEQEGIGQHAQGENAKVCSLRKRCFTSHMSRKHRQWSENESRIRSLGNWTNAADTVGDGSHLNKLYLRIWGQHLPSVCTKHHWWNAESAWVGRETYCFQKLLQLWIKSKFVSSANRTWCSRLDEL